MPVVVVVVVVRVVSDGLQQDCLSFFFLGRNAGYVRCRDNPLVADSSSSGPQSCSYLGCVASLTAGVTPFGLFSNRRNCIGRVALDEEVDGACAGGGAKAGTVQDSRYSLVLQQEYEQPGCSCTEHHNDNGHG
jgi:hypothetical protein